jgi:hypothetical protein
MTVVLTSASQIGWEAVTEMESDGRRFLAPDDWRHHGLDSDGGVVASRANPRRG